MLSSRQRVPSGFRDPEIRYRDQLHTNADSIEGDGYEVIANKAGKQSDTETLHPQHCFGASIQSGVRQHGEGAALLSGKCHRHG